MKRCSIPFILFIEIIILLIVENGVVALTKRQNKNMAIFMTKKKKKNR